MNGTMEETIGTGPLTVYCVSCGGAMRVAPAHAQTAVACPHCDAQVEPWKALHAGGAKPPSPPPPGQGPGDAQPMQPFGHLASDGYSWRNRWVAGALGVLLGTFGVHRFYLGHTGIGIIMVILGVVSFGTISSIWGFIEGILCFCGAIRDVDGLPLRG